MAGAGSSAEGAALLVSRLSRMLTAATLDEVDPIVDDGLRLVTESVGARLGYLSRLSPDSTALQITNVSTTSTGATSAFDDILLERWDDRIFPWFAERVRQGKTVQFSQWEELPPQAGAEKAFCRRHGLQSGMIFPLLVGTEVVGSGTLMLSRQGGWSAATRGLLEATWDTFANVLWRSRMALKLNETKVEVKDLRRKQEMADLYASSQIENAHEFEEIIGSSSAMREIFHRIGQVAETDATVLICGETGTGKELVARAVQRRSRRKRARFVTVNCAALPPTLIESELFGHERGAFTGATTSKPGRFEVAGGGTLFLDEIGDLPSELQAKLLRVLQEGEFERLGSTRTIKVDVRIIAATNRNLEEAVTNGTFRSDLFYRLQVFPITVPPLRERVDEVPLLVWYFISKHQHSLGKEIAKIPQHVMDSLVAYHWPGNVRELENVVTRAMILSPGSTLRLDTELTPRVNRGVSLSTAVSLEEAQRTHVEAVLEQCGWKVKGPNNAADRLGLNPSTLRSRMVKLGVRRPGSRAAPPMAS